MLLSVYLKTTLGANTPEVKGPADPGFRVEPDVVARRLERRHRHAELLRRCEMPIRVHGEYDSHSGRGVNVLACQPLQTSVASPPNVRTRRNPKAACQ